MERRIKFRLLLTQLKETVITMSWRKEKEKYIKCTSSNLPEVGSGLFYKIAHTIRDKHLAPCKLMEVNGEKITVSIPPDTKGIMEDSIKNFFMLKQ